MKVKICGIKNTEDVRFTVNAGADAIGCVIDVPKSPRNIDIHQAKKIFDLLPPFVSSVAVLVPKKVNEIIKIVDLLQPDAVQIHGNNIGFREHEGLSSVLKSTKLIQSISVDVITGKTNYICNDPVKASEIISKVVDAIHIDSLVPGMAGGTGISYNWAIAKNIKQKVDVPIILAGGLNSSNVANAIQIVKPFAVDTSSGVEASQGVKSQRKIFDFIKKAKEVFV